MNNDDDGNNDYDYNDDTFLYITNEMLRDFSNEIHASNVKAGWWTDIKTNEPTLATRNRAELLMLVVSEVSEADHGLVNALMDDKLPHLPMFNVEIADVAIRLFDMIGAENSLYGDTVDIDIVAVIDEADEAVNCDGEDDATWFKVIVNELSAAMEHLRKSRTVKYREYIQRAQVMAFAVAEEHGIDLRDVIEQKLNFNANRFDHKIENRLLQDGKKF